MHSRHHTQSALSVSAAGVPLRNGRPDGEDEGFGFTQPSRQELESGVTRLSPTFTPRVDEEETDAFQKELAAAPGV